jgi:hypothetical protein
MHDRMIKGCILLDLLLQAADAAERMAREHPNPATILRAASIRAQMKEWQAAENDVVQGLHLFPNNQELLQFKEELGRELSRV